MSIHLRLFQTQLNQLLKINNFLLLDFST